MINQPFKYALLLVSLYSGYLHAQQPAKNYVVPLPVVEEWTDNQHAVIRRMENNQWKRFLLDATNGKETAFTGPLVNSNSKGKKLIIKEGDIFLQEGKQLRQLTHTPEIEATPAFSPDSAMIAFTRNHDLYTLHLATGKETRLTADGTELIMNGYSSWVYNEEILGRQMDYRAFWWSPDGQSIAFFRTDDSKVPEFIMTDAGGFHGYVEKQRYPQPGDPNPSVKIGMVPANGGTITWADFKEQDDQYFGTPHWMPDGKSLMVQWLNRGQDHYQLYAVAANGGKKLLYEEKQSTWINLDDENNITFVNGGKQFLLASDKSGFRHLYLHHTDGRLANQVTNGEYVVKDIKRIDEQHKVIYFTANKDGISQENLYRVDYSGKNMKRLTFGPYNHTIKFSPDGTYFTTVYSNAGTPDRVALVSNTGKIIRELGDSRGADFDSTIEKRHQVVFVRSEDDKFNLPLSISYPANMEPGKKYPVSVNIYGGPGSNSVFNRFIHPKFLPPDDVILVQMDHRGCEEFGKRGQNYMHRNLGEWAIKDYIQCVKWLIANAQVDPDKVLIDGYSFGGYMVCYALTHAPEYFKFGIAGGSVIDWRMYDSPYTERYMDSPAENPEGYEKSSVLAYTKNLKGKLLLQQGGIDDNVHSINTLSLVDKLENEGNTNFQMILYPGNRHSVISQKLTHFNAIKNLQMNKWLLDK
ncbi:dipeptidyl-peptidase-4 [Chitinophaga dinghuensis]|uniref:Dipeptidyl-peptidase-4 n=1 Tax=Chitinophaga dinghuensis TaxID=1539050 RepID=A0A327VW82_9BACT|nr:S9 family peptidase [Chitinophaga dinghuensis]RAJ79094.1 dipeptidyl-peptidase-4 [Chitinophaga dinghuensis]